MKKLSLSLAGLILLLAGTLSAQDIAGDWQGTLKAGPTSLRIVLNFSKSDTGAWIAKFYSVDQSPDVIRGDSMSFEDGTVKVSFGSLGAKFEGKLNPEGTAMKGTVNQGLPVPIVMDRATKATAWRPEDSGHKVQFVTVDKDVKLEVLDWGGTGKPLVFLSGLGNTAHIFDPFAPKFTATHHVYGITRRGFGDSSIPATGYSADRLGDDVLVVIDALKLDRPVLAGHSIAGEELSSIGSRHPEKVSGLIYLDAAFPYAFYDRERGNLAVDAPAVEKQLDQLRPGAASSAVQAKLIKELLETTLPQLEKALKEQQKDLDSRPAALGPTLPPGPARMILDGQQKYTDIRVPILAIFALPHAPLESLKNYSKVVAKMEARDLESTGAQAKAFEAAMPSAKVVRLPHADHYVFRSNTDEVLKEMNAFLDGLH